ncbi:MAG: cell wall-associated NlpC family hydrolase [Sulfurimonas sp.]|jgi:cell wall-associated NlpC family hydrolase
MEIIVMNNKFLRNKNILKIGDVLLCNSSTIFGKKINKTTNGNYSHAAIYLGDNSIAESNIPYGVRIDSLDNLLRSCNYIGILRSPEA